MEAKSDMTADPILQERTDREAYRDDGYVFLKQLYPPKLLANFRGQLQRDLNFHHSRTYVRECNLLTKPSIEVYSVEYKPMAFFLWGLTPRISEIAGCELMPSYAYFRIYQQGDVCRVHSDREACEHSLSLMVELGENLPWALNIGKFRRDGPTADVEADFAGEDYATLPMSAGDAVMYQGVRYRHGRLEPNPNSYSAHLFMHWVDAKGPYADHAFDRVAIERSRLVGA